MTLQNLGATGLEARSHRSWNPALVDRSYYLEMNPDVAFSGEDPAEHFWRLGRHEGRNPNALFDGAYYRGQIGHQHISEDVFSHYLEHGAARGLSPHPLFDPAYYESQIDRALVGTSLLEHYLTLGWRLGFSPHPLFDPGYYETISGLTPGEFCPLVHYLTQSEFNSTPHYLFSDAIYVAEIGAKVSKRDKYAYRGGAPLVHYVRAGFRLRPKTHALFDPQDYLKNLAGLALGGGEFDPADLSSAQDVLRHYVERGVYLGLSPSPYFDVKYYLSQAKLPISGDPLRHYLMPGGYNMASPHPGIDLDYYVARTNICREEMPSILHLLGTPIAERVSPHPAFDAERYLAIYDDIGRTGACPILHFLSSGMAEDRSPNEWFSHEYVYSSDRLRDFANESAAHSYFAGTSRNLRLVFVSHDASLTGAPGTVLRLIEDFSRFSNVECFAIVANGGPRVVDFQRSAHTFVMNEPFYSAHPDRIAAVVQQLLAITQGNEPVAAVVNSAESRAMGAALAQAGIPVITLIHEAADLYAAGAFDSIVQCADKIVFGSNYVLERARAVLSLPEHAVMVRGQGLQQDYVGSMPRDVARRAVMGELNLPDDVFLVLACGSIDYRKGADLFVASALSFLARIPEGMTACFIWVGEGNGGILQALANHEIRAGDRQHDIRFIGGRTNVEPYFMAADAFLMTSRVDPFPCVCQEAMACGLPIVAFAEGGGTIEMIGTDAGITVPLGDTAAMAEGLLRIATDLDLRKAFGLKGKARVAEKWNPEEYSGFIADLISEIADIPILQFGSRELKPRLDERRVFLMFDEWTPSPRSHQAEQLVRELNAKGFSAEILLTRGRFVPPKSAGGPRSVPSVPYRFLQPKNVAFHNGRWRTTPAEIAKSLLNLTRRAQPCVLIAVQDELAASMPQVLPHTVALVGLAAGTDVSSVEDIFRVGPGLDRVVVASDTVAGRLLARNPRLAEKIEVIDQAAYGMAINEGEGLPERQCFYIRANLADAAAASKILNLRRHLQRECAGFGVVVHCDRLPKAATRTSVLASAGLRNDELMSAPTPQQVARVLASSRLAIFLDDDASARLLVFQAMANGSVPVVVNPGPGIEDVVIGDQTGVVLRTSNVAPLVDAVVRLVGDQKRQRQLAKAAKEWLGRKSAGPNAAADRYAAMLDEVFAELGVGVTRRTVDPIPLQGSSGNSASIVGGVVSENNHTLLPMA